MGSKEYVFFFGAGQADGNTDMKETLGGKGANLAEMTNIGIPVPPGFTISAEVCDLFYRNERNYPEGLREEVQASLKRLEEVTGRRFADAEDPLLVSVRSGSAVSMPGMMDTVLNLGLNDRVVEGISGKTGNTRFAWDAYRRFIQMFGDVVRGAPHEQFEEVLEQARRAKRVQQDIGLDTDDLRKVVAEFKEVYRAHTQEEFPQKPQDQLWAAIDAVFGSWNNQRAVKYRQIHDIRGLLGTAVNVQSMVFGNFGSDSGTGVCFTRDPSTGENAFYGEFLMNAQGEDVVAGIRTPANLSALQDENPEIYRQLVQVRERLEQHYREMQDIEFTIQQGELFILQTRTGKRTGLAAVRIAVEMVTEGLISKSEAVGRVTPEQLDQLLHPMIDPQARENLATLAVGLNASPGAATGQAVLTADDAERWVKEGRQVLLVRRETSPEDIGGMNVAQGILTSTGGMTSHAAVVARGMGKPCVAGCKDVSISGKTITVAKKPYQEGDWLTIDGTTGEIFEGRVDLVRAEISGGFGLFLSWADEFRHNCVRDGIAEKGFLVRTNADLPRDANVAREFGAEGIGLCRTEHMFFDEGKLEIFQEMIVA